MSGAPKNIFVIDNDGAETYAREVADIFPEASIFPLANPRAKCGFQCSHNLSGFNAKTFKL